MKHVSKNQILKIIIGAQILLLVLILSGITNSYDFLRFDVLMVTIILAFFSVESRRYYWGILFVALGILFNPIFIFSLTKTQWVVADYFLILALLAWTWDYFHSYHKGYLFERFIEKRFPKNEWTIVTYARDSHKRLKRFVESDGNPDFVFRKIASNYAIAVECKFRSRYWNNAQKGEGIGWEEKLSQRYGEYSRTKNIPVYIAIGVGGNPKSPSVVSFVPLEIIQNKYPSFIPRAVVEKYQSMPPI